MKWNEIDVSIRSQLLEWLVDEAEKVDYEEGEALRAMVNHLMTEAPTGCATCPLATSRFNGGQGATTCGLLNHRIVTYGHEMAKTRPITCPLHEETKDTP